MREGSQSSADHIEWALFHTTEQLRSELKKMFFQLMNKITMPTDQADVYAAIAVNSIQLGGGTSDVEAPQTT